MNCGKKCVKEKQECAVVIPFYRESISELEKISLKQAISMFSYENIVFVIPNSLTEVFAQTKYRSVHFSDKFFCSVSAYNKLMLSKEFYQKFIDYEYILIYQLDAFVFSNQLHRFCQYEYDYIGAPWLYGMFYYKNPENCVKYVGNGGLSLRKVDSFLHILEGYTEETIGDNEDLFFSFATERGLKVAPKEIALQFAFESEVEKCYKLNHRQLPFGCHAWEKYNLQFWKDKIEGLGYHIPERYLESGTKDKEDDKVYRKLKEISDFFEHKTAKEQFQNFMKKSKEIKGRKIIVFGCGFYGKSIIRLCEDVGVRIELLCDNDSEIQGREHNGYPILLPEQLADIKGKLFIIISTFQYAEEMKMQLQKLKLNEGQDYMEFAELIGRIG